MNLAKVILLLTVFTLIILVGIFFLLYKNQEKLLFYPEVLPLDYQFAFPFPFEEVYFEPNPSARIHAIYATAKTDSTSKGVILYYHGNAGSLKDWGFVAEQFLALGYDILIPDYRTYGKSIGKLSEQALHEDAHFIYQHLLKQYSATDIILYGRSLGTGVISELATKVQARQVILETPYLGILPMAKAMFPPIIPVRYLLKYRLDNAANLPRIKSPIHIIHGTADEVIPYNHGKKLAESLGGEHALITIEGGQHNNLSTFPEYHKQLKKMLR